MLVCKCWLQASKDPCVNTVFDLEPHFDSALESSRWWTPEFERRIDAMLRSVVDWSDGSLTVIRVRHCSDRSLAFAAERCPNLQVLSIKCCPNVTDESIAKVAARCPKLREVDISHCHQASGESLALIGKKCPDLKILKRNLTNWLDFSQHKGIVPNDYLNACPRDGDSEAAAIGKFMPRLLHLELRFSTLSGKGLALISEGCLNLESLDITGCDNVFRRDIANAMSNLKNLKEIISGCMTIDAELGFSLAQFAKASWETDP